MTAAPVAGQAGLLDSVLHNTPHGICVYGRDRRVILFNAAYAEVMAGMPVTVGESLEEITRRRLEAGEYGTGETAQRYAHATIAGFGTPAVRRRRRPNGTTIEVRTASLSDGGEVVVVSDVTALTQAEAELTLRAGMMDRMLANIRHGIVLWDAAGRVIACNAVVNDMLGAPPGFFRPGLTLDESIDNALERGNLGVGEVARRRAHFLREQDRSKLQMDQRMTRSGRVLEVHSNPVDGGGFVTTYTDVTSIREAEVALRQAKSQAEAANVAKSRFLAAMSHELKTPLTSILSHSEALARFVARSSTPLPQDHAVRQSLDGIHAANHALLSLVETILDVSRLEAGRFDLAEEEVSIPELVRACLRQYDPVAAAGEVALVADVPAGLPPVRGDGRRLRQTLGQLIANALRFTGALGSVAIGARIEEVSGDMLVEVRDSGMGIPDADLERVFEPFVRLDGGQGGAGLGLYVSRSLMRAHGGEVVLRSRAGRGTTAVMLLPASRVLQPGRSTPFRMA